LSTNTRLDFSPSLNSLGRGKEIGGLGMKLLVASLWLGLLVISGNEDMKRSIFFLGMVIGASIGALILGKIEYLKLSSILMLFIGDPELK